ncbi:MAG: AIDA repeat-containing protein [Lentisphaeria bacterium]|nr:AIDA repeat-containing protein [Lentisphaeria bacterium]
MAIYIVSSGQVRDGVSLTNTSMYVYDGGMANNTAVNEWGYLCVYGIANNTTVSYGDLDVYSGGTANNTTVNYDGYMTVFSGRTANGTTLNSSGFLNIYDGGSANSTTVNASGFLYVSDGGMVNNTSVNGDWVSSGGSSVFSAGYLCVSEGGTANNTTLNGYMTVSSKGTATGTTVDSASALTVSGGGTATATTVNSAGWLYVFSGGDCERHHGQSRWLSDCLRRRDGDCRIQSMARGEHLSRRRCSCDLSGTRCQDLLRKFRVGTPVQIRQFGKLRDHFRRIRHHSGRRDCGRDHGRCRRPDVCFQRRY